MRSQYGIFDLYAEILTVFGKRLALCVEKIQSDRGVAPMNDAPKKDFFVSYNHKDEAAAEQIAAILENEGKSVIIQAWDCLPGNNFVQFMDHATKVAKRTIAVLSPNYLTSQFTPSEWQAAFVQDPTGEKQQLIPVRIEACEVTGLLRPIVYIDLVGLPVAQWRDILVRKLLQNPRSSFVPGRVPQLGTPANLSIENKLFVGREQALEELHEQVRSGELTAISSIKGMGGNGKTELALHYALKHLRSQDYPGGRVLVAGTRGYWLADCPVCAGKVGDDYAGRSRFDGTDRVVLDKLAEGSNLTRVR